MLLLPPSSPPLFFPSFRPYATPLSPVHLRRRHSTKRAARIPGIRPPPTPLLCFRGSSAPALLSLGCSSRSRSQPKRAVGLSPVAPRFLPRSWVDSSGCLTESVHPGERGSHMPHKTRPMTALLVFTGLNALLLTTITPVYDFVCFHPYWERRVCFMLFPCVLELYIFFGELKSRMLIASYESYRNLSFRNLLICG